MANFSIKDLDQLIEETLENDKNTHKILIGYKLFSELMSDPKFSVEVTNSALSATKRKNKSNY